MRERETIRIAPMSTECPKVKMPNVARSCGYLTQVSPCSRKEGAHTIWSEHKMMMTPLPPKKWSLLLPHNRGRVRHPIAEIFTSFSSRAGDGATFGIWRNGHPTEMEEAIVPLIVKTSYYTCLILVGRRCPRPGL